MRWTSTRRANRDDNDDLDADSIMRGGVSPAPPSLRGAPCRRPRRPHRPRGDRSASAPLKHCSATRSAAGAAAIGRGGRADRARRPVVGQALRVRLRVRERACPLSPRASAPASRASVRALRISVYRRRCVTCARLSSRRSVPLLPCTLPPLSLARLHTRPARAAGTRAPARQSCSRASSSASGYT